MLIVSKLGRCSILALKRWFTYYLVECFFIIIWVDFCVDRLYSVGKYCSTPANVCWHWPWKSDKPFNINQFLLSSTIFFSRHCFFRRLHHYFQFFILVYKVLFQFPVMIPSTFIVQGGQITCLIFIFHFLLSGLELKNIENLLFGSF